MRGVLMVTKEEFLVRAKKVHGDTYNYMESVFKGVHKKLEIKCSIHGYFSQEVSNHLSGKGCPKCGLLRVLKVNKKRIIPFKLFIEKALKIYGNSVHQVQRYRTYIK